MAGTIAVLDLYYLLVESVFGSVLFAGLGLVVGFTVMCMAGRMSAPTTIMLIAFFAGVFSIGYIGEFGALLLFILAGYYFVTSFARFIYRRIE